MYKQCIVVSLQKMSRGKLAAQACHASLSSYRLASPAARKRWESEGQKKVILQARSVEELKKLHLLCTRHSVPCFLVSDAGLTELPAGTITALGIGPDKEEKIDKVTGSLPLVK